VTYRLAEIVRQTNRPLKEAVYESLRVDAAAALERLDQGGGQVIEIAAQNDKKAERARAWQDRLGVIADRYVELAHADRARTIVIEPSREGRARLNAAIRDRLTDRGELVGAALAAEILTAKGLTKAEAKLALSYEPGDIVRFERAYKPKDQPAIDKDAYLEVVATNPEAGQVTLAKGDGSRVQWEPTRWGGTRSEAYRRESRELRAGDTITWTRNIKELGALNGRTEQVAAVDSARGVALLERGADKPIELDLRANHSRHWDHGYARTVHSAQGQTADRVLAHVESHRANLVHQRSFYVSISRAKEQALVVTDNRQKLIEAVQERSGAKMAALDGVRQVGRAAESAAQAAATTRTAAATNASVRSTTRTMGFGLER
jgi:ATP-dependent exoDNAse (exonuclease V) alpha subunit